MLLALALIISSLAQSATPAAAPGSAKPSWPAWRGADGTNVSPERGWSSQGAEERLWKAQIGRGHSSVVVQDGRLYSQGFDEAKNLDRVSCLDASTGKEQWRYEYPAELDANMHGGGTHSTPVVSQGVVFSFERQGVLRALDAVSGKLLWERDIRTDHDAKPTDYGFGSSPLVAGDLVIVNAAKVVAVDRKSGDPRWVTDDLGAYYSTPALCRLGGKDALASFTRPGLYVLDPADGKVRFHYPFKKGETSVSASTPVVVDDHRLFISAGYGHGAALVDFASGAPSESGRRRRCARSLGLRPRRRLLLRLRRDDAEVPRPRRQGAGCTRGLGMGALTARTDA